MLHRYIISAWFGFLVGSYSSRSFENTEFISYYNYQNIEIERYKKFIETHGLENEYKKHK